VGLEGLEFLLTAEKTFGIAITEEEACRTRTVGDFHALVLAKLAQPPTEGCATSQAFYRLRHGLQATLQVPRALVITTASLSAMLPRRRRAEHWRRLEEAVGLRFPSLVYPWWVKLVAVSTALALGLATTHLLGFPGMVTSVGTLVWTSVISAYLLLGLALPLRVQLPAGFGTVGQSAARLVQVNAPYFEARRRAPAAADVWDELCTILERDHQIPREKITPASDFISDFGFG